MQEKELTIFMLIFTKYYTFAHISDIFIRNLDLFFYVTHQISNLQEKLFALLCL